MQDLQQSFNMEEEIRRHAQDPSVSIFLEDEESILFPINSAYSYEPIDKILVICTPILEKANKPLLLEIIRQVFEGGGLLLKNTKEQQLQAYIEYKETDPYVQTLDFFEDILNPNDYSALRMALFMRSQKDKGVNINGYKDDIRNKFGDRGANIANLCTAGYFETEFKPLYNQLNEEDFYNYYEIAVGRKARALFIHGGMGNEDIETEFKKILKKCLLYHMKDFRIHGLGQHNVDVINTFVLSLLPNERYNIKRTNSTTSPISVEYTITLIWK